jgi:molybdopterin molybdotransferase
MSSTPMPLTPIDTALELLLAELPKIVEQQSVALLQARGRILAQDCVAAVDVPAQGNSAMDGYALCVADLKTVKTTLTVAQRIAAGEVGQALKPGEAARIFTGAPVPDGADAVVMQENCALHGDQLSLLQLVKKGENLRPAGNDIQAGALVLAAGRRLRPQSRSARFTWTGVGKSNAEVESLLADNRR